MSAKCSAGDVPLGYKKTEVGVIPEDWDTRPCSALSDLITVGIVIRPTQYYAKQGVPALRSANIREKGIDDADMVFISEKSNALLSKSQVRTGDVLTVRTGYPGTSAVVPPSFSGSNCIDILITRPSKAVSPTFLSAWINSSFGKLQVLRNQGGLAQQHFNVSDLRNLVVALPSTKAEQEAIAEALSDADALIESLEQLIVKKCQIKQGAMQELLTGKKRLPGFEIKNGYKQTEVGVIPEDWNVVTLSRIASEIGDGIHSTPEYSINCDYFFVNGNNIQNGCIVITKDTKSTNASEYNKHKKNLSSDRTLLLSINGTIGNVAFYSGEPIFLGKSASYINVNENISRLLIFYLLQTADVTAYFNESLTGTTIKNLGLTTIRNTPVPIPPTLVEQEAIAATLSDMDAEITLLEEKLAKARQIKQGMMQELLTGRIRLI